MSTSRAAPGHPFEPVAWMRRCGHLEHPQADRCYRPAREHPGYEPRWRLLARLRTRRRAG